MDDLVQFLRARLAEDEQVARGSEQPSLSWQNFDMDGELRDDANAGTVAVVPREGTRVHIARHDPARVLAEADAKRQVLDIAESIWNADSVSSFRGSDILCTLALPYADHPDYRSEWRP